MRRDQARGNPNLATKTALSSVAATTKKRRIPKAFRVPRTRAAGTMTEAQFKAWVIRQLRFAHRKWRPARLAEIAARRTLPVKIGNQKYEYRCAWCLDWFKRSLVELDHIEACGGVPAWDELPGFVLRLFAEVDGYRMLCLDCHRQRHSADSQQVAVETCDG
jgi:hypothetical protein